jgi:hypothetical protein
VDAHHLSEILALARAGAADQAWATFVATPGWESDDPATLILFGRLLKGRAACRQGPQRRALYREAAAAYAAAAVASHATYPLINAASLSLLAGELAQAAIHAREVLVSLEAHPEEPETAYWRVATRAEALLVLDREAEARQSLGEAMALAPRAWEDQAVTLRQFALILAEQGRDSSWLDPHRPPRSLHFGGHMSFDARVGRRAHLDDRIRQVLAEENVGFGFGALAAGADILVAEALLERGAELHAVLPGGREAFASVSVDPFGKAWRRRFEAVLERAETVRAVRPIGALPDRMTIGLGDEVAMGAAVMNARRLESSALQLLVVPEDGHASESNRIWAEHGWRQRIVAAPREALPVEKPPPLPVSRHQRLALLAIAPPADAEIEPQLAALHERLRRAAAPAVPAYFTGRHIVVAYADPAEAARAAVAVASAGEAAIGGHYGIADPVDDPFSGGRRLVGEAAALADAAADSAPPGSVCVTADFAAALAASGEKAVRSELIGELEANDGGGPIELHALKPRPVEAEDSADAAGEGPIL